MITIEAGYLFGCLKLEEVKTIVKMNKIEKPIRVNKNIAKVLLTNGYIKCEEDHTYSLTSKGKNCKLFFERFTFSFDSYLRIDDVRKWISRATSKRKFVYKIMITSCFACGKDADRHDLEHIVDKENNDGMYCSSCLGKGYDHALKQLKERKDAASCNKNTRGIKGNAASD